MKAQRKYGCNKDIPQFASHWGNFDCGIRVCYLWFSSVHLFLQRPLVAVATLQHEVLKQKKTEIQ